MFVVVFLEIRTLIRAFITALRDFESSGDAPVITGLKIADFELAIENDGEGGGLDPANGSNIAGPRTEHAFGQRAGAIDSNEPVALAATTGGVGQSLHLFGAAEVFEGLFNTLVRHRGHPQTLKGLFALRQLVDISEDQFALAAGVAGIDDAGDIRLCGPVAS